MSTPKVSIVIPCYNAEKWIMQCVSSALEQAYDNVEVIAVDNESKDNTLNILENIKNDKLKVSTAKNIYPHCWDEAREKGFSLSTGKYLFTLASDDFLHKEYVSSCMKYISAASDKIMIFQSPIRGIKNDVEFNEIKHLYNSFKQLKKMLLSKCPVNSPTAVYNRKLYDEGILKTRPEKYSGAADYDLYCSLVDRGHFIFPANKWLGYYYRWHPEQATWEMHKEKNRVNYDKLIQEYWREKWKM